MDDKETREILTATLDILKQLAIHLDCNRRWMVELAQELRDDANVAQFLERPFLVEGRLSKLQQIDALTQNIDALIQRLKDR